MPEQKPFLIDEKYKKKRVIAPIKESFAD